MNNVIYYYSIIHGFSKARLLLFIYLSKLYIPSFIKNIKSITLYKKLQKNLVKLTKEDTFNVL